MQCRFNTLCSNKVTRTHHVNSPLTHVLVYMMQCCLVYVTAALLFFCERPQTTYTANPEYRVHTCGVDTIMGIRAVNERLGKLELFRGLFSTYQNNVLLVQCCIVCDFGSRICLYNLHNNNKKLSLQPAVELFFVYYLFITYLFQTKIGKNFS